MLYKNRIPKIIEKPSDTQPQIRSFFWYTPAFVVNEIDILTTPVLSVINNLQISIKMVFALTKSSSPGDCGRPS